MAPTRTLSPVPEIIAHRSPNTKNLPIKFKAEYNMVCNTTIPAKHANQGYEQIVEFIMRHPLFPALSNDASTLNYVLAMEFWYSCAYNEGNNSFEGYVMVEDVATLIRFNVHDLRRVLGLPVLVEYEEEVPEEDAITYMKEAMQYDSSKGDRKYMAVCVTGVWKYLLYTVTKCLGCKTSSMDQLNDMEIQLLYSLVHGRNLDFASLMFNTLKTKVMASPRIQFVLYPRFICMMVEDQLGHPVYSNLDTPSTDSPIVQDNIFAHQTVRPTVLTTYMYGILGVEPPPVEGDSENSKVQASTSAVPTADTEAYLDDENVLAHPSAAVEYPSAELQSSYAEYGPSALNVPNPADDHT